MHAFATPQQALAERRDLHDVPRRRRATGAPLRHRSAGAQRVKLRSLNRNRTAEIASISDNGSRPIGCSTGRQRVVEEFQAILTPKHFVVEHEARRPEGAGRDGLAGILRISGGGCFGPGERNEFGARELRRGGKLEQGCFLGEVALSFPDGRKRVARNAPGSVPLTTAAITKRSASVTSNGQNAGLSVKFRPRLSRPRCSSTMR